MAGYNKVSSKLRYECAAIILIRQAKSSGAAPLHEEL
jgi:hypothetical protein